MRLTALLVPLLTVAFVAMPPAAAHEPATPERATEPRTITVSGTGEATAPPDVATLRFSVVSRAEGAAAAMTANAEAATAVRDRLRALGVEARDMQTSGLSLGPYYEEGAGRRYDESQIAGYEARNGLMVRLRELEGVGEVIDAAVRAGANGLDSLSFGIEDQDALRGEARRDAMTDARESAALLAEAADARLGRVVSIEEAGGRGGPRPVMMRADAVMESAPVTPIEGGEQAVNATVQVVYELE